MKVVLLDIDGVLNHSGCPLDCPCREKAAKDADFYPSLVERLNRITDATGAQIVIASTWRVRKTVEELQAILVEGGVTAPVYDKCPWLWDDTFDPEDPERTGKYINVEKRAANWLWTQRHTPEAHPERYPECANLDPKAQVLHPGEVWYTLPTKSDKPEHVVVYAFIEKTPNHLYHRAKINYELIPGLANSAGLIYRGDMRIARPSVAGQTPEQWLVGGGAPRQLISLDKSQPVLVRMTGFTEDGKIWLEDRYDLG